MGLPEDTIFQLEVSKLRPFTFSDLRFAEEVGKHYALSRDLVLTSCGCSDSHGTSIDENGVTEKRWVVRRCREHQDKPSIYERLR